MKQDLFSADGAEVMREALTADNVEILTTETFQSGDAKLFHTINAYK